MFQPGSSKGLVSILICTYNASQTIAQTLRSCLGQTYGNIEILIHDDQSKDNTLYIVNSLQDQRIHVIKSGQKLGPYGGLNFLLKRAQGEYIAIQDHDDLRHPSKIKKQITFLESHPEYRGCGTKTLMRYESDQKGFLYYLGEKNYYTIHPSLIFRTGEERYPINTNYMTDAYFQKMELCKRGKKLIYNIDETLTFHLIRSGATNLSYKRFTYSRATFCVIFQLHPVWYGICIIGWESLRKILYPLFHLIGKGKWIDVMERKPFELLGNKISDYPLEKIEIIQEIKNVILSGDRIENT